MLTWTTLSADVTSQWAELTNLLAKVDDTDEVYEPEDLAEELTEHGFNPELDSWAGWDGDQLVAFGQLRVRDDLTSSGEASASLTGGVHPNWRGRGIGSDLLNRMEPRALALASSRHPGSPILLNADGGKEKSSAEALLIDHQYQPTRYFTDMRRSLPGDPLPIVDARVRPYTPDLCENVRIAHNDAFASHWGFTAHSPQKWADYVSSRSFRAEFSRVILSPAGEVLSYTMCGEWVARELYVSLVGTRPRARGQGLARAVLSATIADAAAARRHDLIELEVDSASPTGANALYASVGFTPVRTRTILTKSVAAAGSLS